MQKNYDRLFVELAELIKDRAVYQSLDDNLKTRVDNLLIVNYQEIPNQTLKELSCHDTQELFGKQSSSPFEPSTEIVVLKQISSNNANIRQKFDQSARITAIKIETSAFDDDKRTSKFGKNCHKMLTNSKNRSKSTKDLVRYNMQTSKSKTKSKPKQQNIKVFNQCLSKKSLNNRSQKTLQKSIQKITIYDKYGKQNKKYLDDKQELKNFKKLSKNIHLINSDHNNPFSQPRLKTAHSNLHESRQILKKLATMQTQPSRTSLSSNKTQNIKENKSMKIIEQDLTIMESINKKQQILNQQRRQIQSDIKELQRLIEQERLKFQSTNVSIVRMSSEISKMQINERGSSQDFKISRKKSENFISQSRQIQSKLVEVSRDKDTVNESIEQEKYLVNMYITVIEEIKSQLKIQQTQKIDLIKKLVTIKNTEKMCMEKYLSKQATSEQIFRTMNESMKKWV